MPIGEHDTLSPGFERRLREALESFVPPSRQLSSARYKSAAARRARRAWMLVPALVGVGAVGMAFTAAAATGSPNPAVWSERAGSVIQSVSHIPAAEPKVTPTPKSQPSHVPSPASQGTDSNPAAPSRGSDSDRDSHETQETSDKEEASPRPKPTPSPHATPESAPEASNPGETSHGGEFSD
jgi:hypothetical protein